MTITLALYVAGIIVGFCLHFHFRKRFRKKVRDSAEGELRNCLSIMSIDHHAISNHNIRQCCIILYTIPYTIPYHNYTIPYPIYHNMWHTIPDTIPCHTMPYCPEINYAVLSMSIPHYCYVMLCYL